MPRTKIYDGPQVELDDNKIGTQSIFVWFIEKKTKPIDKVISCCFLLQKIE